VFHCFLVSVQQLLQTFNVILFFVHLSCVPALERQGMALKYELIFSVKLFKRYHAPKISHIVCSM
jgi:hypothetical protein